MDAASIEWMLKKAPLEGAFFNNAMIKCYEIGGQSVVAGGLTLAVLAVDALEDRACLKLASHSLTCSAAISRSPNPNASAVDEHAFGDFFFLL
jgi:hypothetical protein